MDKRRTRARPHKAKSTQSELGDKAESCVWASSAREESFFCDDADAVGGELDGAAIQVGSERGCPLILSQKSASPSGARLLSLSREILGQSASLVYQKVM